MKILIFRSHKVYRCLKSFTMVLLLALNRLIKFINAIIILHVYVNLTFWCGVLVQHGHISWNSMYVKCECQKVISPLKWPGGTHTVNGCPDTTVLHGAFLHKIGYHFVEASSYDLVPPGTDTLQKLTLTKLRGRCKPTLGTLCMAGSVWSAFCHGYGLNSNGELT